MTDESNGAGEPPSVLGKFSSENPNPVLRVSREGTILYANGAGSRLLPASLCALGQPLPEFLQRFIVESTGQGNSRDLEVEADGRFFSFSITPVKDADFVYLYGHDITRLKKTEMELIGLKEQAQNLALRDALTGLPNRTLLEDRLGQAMAQCSRYRKKLAVVFIDLDNFKQINDAHGHRAGDQALIEVARRLQSSVRKTDTVARWGGDEIILLLPDVTDAEQARATCERIKRKVQEDFTDAPMPAPLTLSMGVALFPEDASRPETLLEQADAALYLAKTRGRDQVVLFGESEARDSFQQKASLSALLKQAVAENKIQVQYQPIVDARTGCVAGVEALALWHDEAIGRILPATFVSLAENMGLISELGRRVLEQAVRQLGLWQQDGLDLSLSVNISIRQIFQSNFLAELQRLTAAHKVLPQRLVLELTESQSLLGLALEGKRLSELAQGGFRISIDDFGQGYSSFARLHDLPVHELKIDREFVRNLETEKGRRLVHAMVEMARVLGIETVAEGVETECEMARVKALGVDRMQGYYFARPMPGPEMTAALKSRANWWPQ
ncbi:MAG TPA: EAL domain-containing protein [Verrucomicrobiae bacterium]|jgi:diguanylate cyclase (GGDEF)-like protein